MLNLASDRGARAAVRADYGIYTVGNGFINRLILRENCKKLFPVG
jgi:hypothetical protein